MVPMKTPFPSWQRQSLLCPSKAFVWDKETCLPQTILQNTFSVPWIVRVLFTYPVRMLFMNFISKSQLLNIKCGKNKGRSVVVTKFVQVCFKHPFNLSLLWDSPGGLVRANMLWHLWSDKAKKPRNSAPLNRDDEIVGRGLKGEIFMICR